MKEPAQMIHPVLMAGGSGTRLWPLSRADFPKQFHSFDGQTTLFQQALDRVSAPGFTPPVIITADAFRFIVEDQLADQGGLAQSILIEPEPKDTAAALLAATLRVARHDPKALILALPADHVIQDTGALHRAVMAAKPAVAGGDIFCFGIPPDRAEVGYGYLSLPAPAQAAAAQKLLGFVEKPDADRAAEMLAAGTYLWNAGLFFYRADMMIAAFETHAPALLAQVQMAHDAARRDMSFTRLAPGPWGQIDPISIDYAVMEKLADIWAMPLDAGWSDLGDWDAIWRGQSQEDAVTTLGGAQALNSQNSLLFRSEDGPDLLGLGLDNIVAVATKDAVLIADRHAVQDVKDAVATLQGMGQQSATTSLRAHRPWGWYETLGRGDRFQVKRIVVKPGGVLSLQSHHHRAEHWVVVEGTARVTLEGRETLVTENQSIYVPLGAQHRLENPGTLPMVLIEIQTGSYLGEDDITRYEDLYNRMD